MNKTKILILCGGRGRRLGKFTESMPKPLVEIHSKPLLVHIVEKYLSQGYENFIFSIGYLGDKIREVVEGLAINAEFSDAGEDSGILNRLHHALPLLTENTIISYGDTFVDIELKELERHQLDSGKVATIVIAPIQNPFGIIEVGDNNQVVSFTEKPMLNHYIGCMILNKKFFESIPASLIPLSDGQGLVKAFQVLSALGELSAYQFNGLQVTINTPEEYRVAEKELGDYFTM